MFKHSLRLRRAWFVAIGCVVLAACGGDDGPGADDIDGGTYCNPATGGVGTCYCSDTGRQAVRYCDATSNQWGACVCPDPYPQPVCTEGSRQACFCADGTQSERICLAANTVGPCMCDSDLPLDSGVTDSGTVDSGTVDGG